MTESSERITFLAGLMEALFGSGPLSASPPSYQPPNPNTDPTAYAAYKKQMDDWLEHTGRQFLISARPYLSIDEALKPVPKSLPDLQGYSLTPRQVKEYNDLKLRFMYHHARRVRAELQKYDNDIVGRKEAIIRFGEFLHEASGGPNWREKMHAQPTPSAVYVQEGEYFFPHRRQHMFNDSRPWSDGEPSTNKPGPKKNRTAAGTAAAAKPNQAAKTETASTKEAHDQIMKAIGGDGLDDDTDLDSEDTIDDYMDRDRAMRAFLGDDSGVTDEKAELFEQWDDGNMDEVSKKRMQMWFLKQMRKELKQEVGDTRSSSSTTQLDQEKGLEEKNKGKAGETEMVTEDNGQGDEKSTSQRRGQRTEKGKEKALVETGGHLSSPAEYPAHGQDLTADGKSKVTFSMNHTDRLFGHTPPRGLPDRMPKTSISAVGLNLAASPGSFSKPVPSLRKMATDAGEKQRTAPKEELGNNEKRQSQEKSRAMLREVEEHIAKTKEISDSTAGQKERKSRKDRELQAPSSTPKNYGSKKTGPSSTAPDGSASLGKRKAQNLSSASSSSDSTPAVPTPTSQPLKKKVATTNPVAGLASTSGKPSPATESGSSTGQKKVSDEAALRVDQSKRVEKRKVKKIVIIVHKKRFLPSKRPLRDCWHSTHA